MEGKHATACLNPWAVLPAQCFHFYPLKMSIYFTSASTHLFGNCDRAVLGARHTRLGPSPRGIFWGLQLLLMCTILFFLTQDGNGYIDENELDALLKDLCEKNKQVIQLPCNLFPKQALGNYPEMATHLLWKSTQRICRGAEHTLTLNSNWVQHKSVNCDKQAWVRNNLVIIPIYKRI